MQLEGKKALVTGTSGDIGRAIVARLQAEGAIVTGTDIADQSDHAIFADKTRNAAPHSDIRCNRKHWLN